MKEIAQDALERNFKRNTDMLISETLKELALAKALSDRASEFREQAKLNALQKSMELFEMAKTKPSLDTFAVRFLDSLWNYKAEIEGNLQTAKSSGDKDTLIIWQIHNSVVIGPIEQTFKAFYKY